MLKVSKDVRVLIIGKLISYKLVDTEMLHQKGVEPYFVFLESERGSHSEQFKAVYVESLCEALIKPLIVEFDIQAICCFNDNFLLQVASLRQELGLMGISLEEMKKFKRKSAMYSALADSIEIIPFLSVNEFLCFDKVKATIGPPPYFLKPDELAGAEGTQKINNEEQFIEFMAKYKPNSEQLVIQPYIDADLYHCDLFVEGGHIIYSQARKYSYPNHNILKGKIIASFPVRDDFLRHRLEEQAEIVQKQLGFKNGVMHTEFFVEQSGHIKFLETNIRQPGGGINLIHKERAGISVETAMVLLEMQLGVELNLKNRKSFTSGYIPMRQGVVTGFRVPELKGKVDFEMRVEIDQVCNMPSSASHASVSYLGEYSSIDDMEEDFKLIEQHGIVDYK